MATFTYQVDRAHEVLSPLTFHPDAELKGEAFTLAPGETVIFRGIVELAGAPRYAFDAGDRKAYSQDRAALDAGLRQRYDEMARM